MLLTDCKSEVLTTPFLGLINLLETLTGLRKADYLITGLLQRVVKDTNLQPDEDTHKKRS